MSTQRFVSSKIFKEKTDRLPITVLNSWILYSLAATEDL